MSIEKVKLFNKIHLNFPTNPQNSGLILIEAIVGLAFAGFVVMGLTLLFTTGNNAYLHSRSYTQALYLAESKLEETSLYSFSILTVNSTNTEELNGKPYTWTRIIQSLESNPSLQQIEVTVEWNEPDGKRQAKLISQEIIKQ